MCLLPYSGPEYFFTAHFKMRKRKDIGKPGSHRGPLPIPHGTHVWLGGGEGLQLKSLGE